MVLLNLVLRLKNYRWLVVVKHAMRLVKLCRTRDVLVHYVVLIVKNNMLRLLLGYTATLHALARLNIEWHLTFLNILCFFVFPEFKGIFNPLNIFWVCILRDVNSCASRGIDHGGRGRHYSVDDGLLLIVPLL